MIDTRLPVNEIETLKAIVKDVNTCTNDRNIIVHGLVNAIIGNSHAVVFRQPCWTIYKGEGRGKGYPLSTVAAETVANNAQLLGRRVCEFNGRHRFIVPPEVADTVEINWPLPLT